ncbi:MAG TPA: SH3 domain-containing protein, partial [Clostridia bacterium]|nr:SH3 domain-containing protein [Clostridia bacterium]
NFKNYYYENSRIRLFSSFRLPLRGMRNYISLLALVGALLFSSCSGGSIGYGVVLLSPDAKAIETGALVEIKKESDLSDTYTVGYPDSQETYEIDRWRVEAFEEKRAAASRAKEYEQYKDLFARNLRDGLAVREQPDISASRVYKLRKNQELKIIEQTDTQEQIGGHDGVWYKVMTKDGTQGYSFDYYLNVFDITAKPEEQQGPDLTTLRETLAKSFHPESFKEMQEKQQIDLERFSSDYGLFSDMDKQSISIRLYNMTHSFEYDEVKRINEKRYAFIPSELEIIIHSEDRIQAIFSQEDKTYDPVFIHMTNEKVAEIREMEQKRRAEQYDELVESGPLFTSNAYGEIEFMEDRQFVWRRIERLVPSIVPYSSYREGSLSMEYFLSSELRPNYTGVLAFVFDQGPDSPVFFLYTLEQNALRLEYIPARNIEDKVVQQRSSSRLIMAFFGQSPSSF